MLQDRRRVVDTDGMGQARRISNDARVVLQDLAAGNDVDDVLRRRPRLSSEDLTNALREVLEVVADEMTGSGSTSEDATDAQVWIGRTDSYYHVSSQCSALRGDVDGGSIAAQAGEAMTIDQAEADGYEVCKWCRAWLYY